MAEPVGERFAPHLQLPACRARPLQPRRRAGTSTHTAGNGASRGQKPQGSHASHALTALAAEATQAAASRSLAAHPDGAGGDASPSQPDGTGSQQTSLKPSKDAPWQVPNLLSSPRGKSQTSPVLPAPGREEARSSHVLEEPSPQFGDGGTERAPSVCPRAGTTPRGWGQHQRSPPRLTEAPVELGPNSTPRFPSPCAGHHHGLGNCSRRHPERAAEAVLCERQLFLFKLIKANI